jgi:nitroreductase
MINETIQNIMDRRSIRGFLPDPLSPEQLQILQDTALASPSGMNRQPWQFHFIVNQDMIRQISRTAIETFQQDGDQEIIRRITSRHPSIFYGAPLLVVITTAKGSLDGLDAGIAVENLAIAAQSMGLGSCIVGLAGAAFRGMHATNPTRLIQMPDGYEFAISIAIGYPAMTKEAHEKHLEKITLIK